MLDNTFGLLGFSYAVIGRRSNLMLGTPFVVGLALRIIFLIGEAIARARVTYRRLSRRE